MDDPRDLSTLIAEHFSRMPENSPARQVLAAALDGHIINQHRRAAVLRHADLARKLTEYPLNYTRPAQWNGFIPPAVVNTGEPEKLRQGHGAKTFVNPKGKRTGGEIPNIHSRREALIAISTEAWNRDQAAHDARGVLPPAADLPDLLPGDDQQPALPAGAAGPAGPLDPAG